MPIENTGLSIATNSEIWNFATQLWFKFLYDPNDAASVPNMTDRSPEGQFFKIFCEQLSNLGLDESQIVSLWMQLQEVYRQGYLPYASGAQKDALFKYRLVTRFLPLAAQGILGVTGTAGTVIPINTSIAGPNNVHFLTTRAVTLNGAGFASAPVVADAIGAVGNIAASTIQGVQAASATFSNIPAVHEFNLATLSDSTVSLPNDGSQGIWQTFNVADLNYPGNLSGITLAINNPGASGLFSLGVSIVDDATNQTLFRTAESISILPSGDQTLRFTDSFDLQGSSATKIRIVPRNAAISAGVINLKTQNAGPYPALYVNSLPTIKTLFAKLSSSIPGQFGGGREAESDQNALARYYYQLDKGGAARKAAIRSYLLDLPDLLDVRIEENNTGFDTTSTGGRPANSVEPITWGSSPNSIGRALLKSPAAGLRLYGNRSIFITDELGQPIQIMYAEANLKYAYINMVLQGDQTFPADGKNLIRQAIVQEVGGIDINNILQVGNLGIGTNLSLDRIIFAARSAVTGIKTLAITFGFLANGSDWGTVDLVATVRDRILARADQIFIG